MSRERTIFMCYLPCPICSSRFLADVNMAPARSMYLFRPSARASFVANQTCVLCGLSLRGVLTATSSSLPNASPCASAFVCRSRIICRLVSRHCIACLFLTTQAKLSVVISLRKRSSSLSRCSSSWRLRLVKASASDSTHTSCHFEGASCLAELTG